MERPHCILIVDDNPNLRKELRSLLTCYQEFEVGGEAGDGLEAIDSVKKYPSRPGLDGYFHAPDGRDRGYQGNQETMAGD